MDYVLAVTVLVFGVIVLGLAVAYYRKSGDLNDAIDQIVGLEKNEVSLKQQMVVAVGKTAAAETKAAEATSRADNLLDEVARLSQEILAFNGQQEGIDAAFGRLKSEVADKERILQYWKLEAETARALVKSEEPQPADKKAHVKA